jgi:transposase
LIAVRPGERHHRCPQCNHNRRYPPHPPDNSSADSDPSSSSVLFDRDSSSLSRLTEEQRWSIIALHKDGQKRRVIASKIHCSLNTVSHWINYHKQHGTVAEEHRSGRKRKTDENTNINIALTAEVETFITPKMIKRQLDLPVSHHTVRRRLDEVGLFGRVSRKEFPFSPDHIRQRLSFANGYMNWTEEKWGEIMFSDETHIHLGQRGQIWAQRPAGKAYDYEYMSHKESHPDRVSIWGCFCSKGVGGIEVFTDVLDAPLMQHILATHLKTSFARLLPGKELWLLQDNDPKHCSRIVHKWLHDAGIDLIDFPPYSPDLNPIENLWNDLKRRVEQHNACNIEELTQVLYDEWYATSTDFLAKLAESMPRRCQLVVENEGHKTKY